MDKSNKAFLILGLGLGLIIANVLGYVYPKIVYEEMSEAMIIERARELGMVSLRESIEKEKEEVEELEKTEDIEDVKEEEIVVAPSELIIEIGDTLLDVSEKLFDLGLIDSKSEFEDYVYKKELQRRINYGSFMITKGDTYEDIIYTITKMKKE